MIIRHFNRNLSQMQFKIEVNDHNLIIKSVV